MKGRSMGSKGIADALAERTAARLALYRRCVAAAAAGEPLSQDDVEELRRAMGALGLPSHAFRRDVRAWAGSATAGAYRRAELQAMHPHLFDDADAWARERAVAIGRRGGRPWPR